MKGKSEQEPVFDSSRGLPRKLTPIATVGGIGQLFTVYEKNWICPDCSQENYAARTKCFRCRSHKPAGQADYVTDPALASLQQGATIDWQEAMDPNTKQIYYYNKATGATQWERPAELGPAPHATGWFGRGRAGSGVSQVYAQRNLMYLSRPARKQKDFIDPKKYHVEGANEYNIWYNRYLGDEWDQKLGKDKAPDRCILETDAGATTADASYIQQLQSGKVADDHNKKKDRKFFCLHFARGMCAKGKDCYYYHRIPTPEDDARCDELFDCFGRQRHNKHRDDMSGVGSFMKPCRTLYVAGLVKQKYEPQKALEEALWKHFGEWGEIENVNVIYRISIAFVRYRLRTSAEFAKETMSNQSLDHNEIMCIRWAHDDPNPVAQDAINRADRDALYALMTAKGISLDNAGFEYPAEYSLPAAKKARLEDGTDITGQFPELAYPDTDNQYSNATASDVPAASATSQMTAEEYAKYCEDYYINYLASQNIQIGDGADDELGADDAAGNSIPADTSTSTAANDKVGEWTRCVDEETGAVYYFNEVTQESSWGLPSAASST